jgi:hypothetical protein
MKIHYEDTIKDICERYFKIIIPLDDNIRRSSALSIFTKNTISERFNIVIHHHSSHFSLCSINLYNGSINRKTVNEFEPNRKFNLFTSSSGRKLFYDKLLIQGPQLKDDPYNKSIRQPLIPTLLDFKLHSQESDCFGNILYRYN